MSKKDWREIDGWFSEADAEFVSSILMSIHNGTVVEIGVFKGRSSAVMMPIALKNGNQYYAIDNFYGGIDETTPASKVQRSEGAKVMAQFMANMKEFGIHRSDYGLYKCNSVEASVYLPTESVDFCFVDGDHAYESVKADLETWWKKIKVNGILSGHDYNNADVRKALDEFIKDKDLKVQTGGNCFAVKK